jgi:hypothetical protein
MSVGISDGNICHSYAWGVTIAAKMSEKCVSRPLASIETSANIRSDFSDIHLVNDVNCIRTNVARCLILVESKALPSKNAAQERRFSRVVLADEDVAAWRELYPSSVLKAPNSS